MNNKIAKILVVAFMALLAETEVGIGQQDIRERSITSDDFAQRRPSPKRRAARQKKATYSFVRTEKNLAQQRTDGNSNRVIGPAKASAPTIISEIGITMWRLRPPLQNEIGHLFEVVDIDKTRKMWLAERVGINSEFRSGDKIRFAIESSLVGYLYVIDRETFIDGSLGPPFLIFPESMRDDNSVGPGVLVDIPDQRDDVPYFNMTPQSAGYTGELLTVVISPKPLTNLSLDRDGKITSIDEFSKLEFGSEADIFSRADVQDKLFSKSESESSCGGKTRRSARKGTAENPCGITSRKLTRDEPLPQTIYRARTLAGEPAVVFIKLAVP